ncbi:MAG: LCP family protein [Patescibacteria group bacterium]|nr:LCP family protein [Patescibacteria group bacterium]
MVYYPPEKQFDIERIVNQNDDDFVDSKSDKSEKKNRKKLSKKIFNSFVIVFLILFVSGGYLVFKTNSTFDKVTGKENSVIKSIIKMLPINGTFFQILPTEGETSTIDKLKRNELDRLNILLLGIRGVGDPNGGLLTDTIMVVSIKPKEEKLALISIPRDLYVEIPYHDYNNKINEAYAVGTMDGGWQKGLEYSTVAVEHVTGLDIHYSMSVDFEAFKEIIDTLGGITITLNEPFVETNQFEEGVIELPKGTQTIDGATALLFARARFSTNDFDRARRQQQVLLAVKEKAFGLGVISNPLKVVSILNSFGNHIKTDAELWEIKDIAEMIKEIDIKETRKKVFDTTNNGYLYSSRDINGAYILLPKGDNFNNIHGVCRGIFN